MRKDIPALLGGKPVFDELIPIAIPFLPRFSDISPGLKDLFKHGQITNARYVKEFEEAAADYLGVKYTVAVSSCTSGLILALKSMGLKGEVTLPSFTFSASGHALLWNNLKPVFVDCEPDTFAISASEVKKKITNKTAAILGVYIFGNPPEISELESISKKHGVKLIFDSAHAFGSKYKGKRAGGFGDVEVFSLSPSKVLTTGEGGIVATNNKELARMVRIGKDYGNPGDYDPEYNGLSVRMTEFSALIGLRALKTLDEVIAERNERAEKYRKRLSKLPGISFQKIDKGNYSTYKMFSMLVDEKEFGVSRDVVMKALSAENIQTRRYFYPPMHMQKIYRNSKKGCMTNTENVADSIVCLPMNSRMREYDVDKVCDAIERIYEARERFFR